MKAKVCAVCVSERKGTPKTQRETVVLVAGHGIDGDAHAGDWHRQVSLLSLERIEEFRNAGADVEFGAFGENIVIGGLDWDALTLGSRLRLGQALLEVTQFGKECHDRCHIFQTMGDCIMPRHGVFARVVEGGDVQPGDRVEILPESADASNGTPAATPEEGFAVGLVTVSDRASSGDRVDLSGAAMREMVQERGMRVIAAETVPDEIGAIAGVIRRLCDTDKARLVLTSGGTGFSRRDVTPEATLQVLERLCPGIPEAMRSLSLPVSRRAMLSRAVAGIRGGTLIVNLPGSPRAVRECLGFIIDELVHGMEVLSGDARECGS